MNAKAFDVTLERVTTQRAVVRVLADDIGEAKQIAQRFVAPASFEAIDQQWRTVDAPFTSTRVVEIAEARP